MPPIIVYSSETFTDWEVALRHFHDCFLRTEIREGQMELELGELNIVFDNNAGVLHAFGTGIDEQPHNDWPEGTTLETPSSRAEFLNALDTFIQYKSILCLELRLKYGIVWFERVHDGHLRIFTQNIPPSREFVYANELHLARLDIIDLRVIQ